jgi:single-stranded-DNA-specific exonuclease
LDVFYTIPDRATEGHGFNIPDLRNIIEKGDDLIVTCDCGVGDTEEIALAPRTGADVTVTDHHELPREFPVNAPLVSPPPSS